MEQPKMQPLNDLNLDTLKALGVKQEWLQEAAQRILNAFFNATPNDAANAAGTFAYHEGVRVLRDILLPKGWKRNKINHLEVVTSPDERIHILVSSGNRYTGNPRIEPSTKNTKGDETKRVVLSNAKNLYLFPELNETEKVREPTHQTWFFLYHFDKKQNEMRIELSLPYGYNETVAKVNRWQQRIIFNPISFNPSKHIVLDDAQYTEEIDFDIRKKNHE